MQNVKIKYKDKELEYESGVLLSKIAQDVSSDFKYDILLATVNNRATNLDVNITRSCSVNFFDLSSKLGNKAYERGLYFLFAKAVKDLLNCDVKIKHKIRKEIYCEILTNNLISEVTVEKIKIKIRELVEKNIPISKIVVSRIDAIDYYEKINQNDKADSLRYISNSSISLYKLDDMLDYFYGVLPNKTGVLKDYNLKFLEDNKVVLMMPYLYDLESDLKFKKEEKLINVINENDKYIESLNISSSVELNKAISTGNYKDIIRISEAISNNRLFEIADKIKKSKDIKIVLVTGPSSSGKTTSAKKLSLFLKSKGLDPISISVDDFFIDMKDRILDDSGNPERESIDVIDTNQFNKKISDLLNGKEVYLPRYNFSKGMQEVRDKPTKLKENGILVIEGIHAFNESLTEMIPDKNKFKLFVCPLTPLNVDNHNQFKSTDNRLLRRIIRDNSTRSTLASKTLEDWKKVRKAEEKTVLPYIKDADEIFNTSFIYELGVLKTYAEPLLFSVSEDDKNYYEAIRLINLFRVILGIPSDNVPTDSILREFIGGSCFKD